MSEEHKTIIRENKFFKIIPEVFTFNHYHIYICHDLEEPYYYTELFNLLNNATENDIINFYINNNGGYLWTLFQLVNNIMYCKAHTIGHLEGLAASAAGMLFLACKEYVIKPYSSIMIHNYSSIITGKGGEIKENISFNDNFIRKFYHDIYDGFLTKDELEQVFAGKDFWFDSDEIFKRLKNKIKKEKKDKKNKDKNKENKIKKEKINNYIINNKKNL